MRMCGWTFYAYNLYYICRALSLNLCGSLRYCLQILVFLEFYPLLCNRTKVKRRLRNRHKKLKTYCKRLVDKLFGFSKSGKLK